MSVVTVDKNTYKVDPLYQWDLNQVLEVRGLSLATIPEIHFCHMDMSRAIVRQASMDAAGVIRADIPNSLLQKPYKLQAYVCIYEGSTFKTLYKVEVPVNGRAKPADYTLEDDPEVYSFNALENEVVNALARLDSETTAAKQNYNAANAALAEAKSAFDKAKTDVEGLVDEAVGQLTAEDVGAAAANDNLTEFVNGALRTLNGAAVDVGGGVEIISYTGTGNCGSSTPNSVTIDKEIKMVMYLGSEDIVLDNYFSGVNLSSDNEYQNIMPMSLVTTTYTACRGIGATGSGDMLYGKKSADGKTYYWYYNTTNNSTAQLNNANYKYYIAVFY